MRHRHEMTTSNGDHAEVGGKRDRPPDAAENLRGQLAEARRELERLRNENQRLRGRLGLPSPDAVAESQLDETAPTLFPVSESEALPEVDARSPVAEKVALVWRLFRGQDEAYAVRWTNPRSGKAGYAPAVTGGWNGRSTTGRPKRHLPLTDEVVAEHLQGSKTIGVYPLRKDDTCWFLACDFDGGSWALDAAAFAFPMAFKGKLVQHTGRLLRPHPRQAPRDRVRLRRQRRRGPAQHAHQAPDDLSDARLRRTAHRPAHLRGQRNRPTSSSDRERGRICHDRIRHPYLHRPRDLTATYRLARDHPKPPGHKGR